MAVKTTAGSKLYVGPVVNTDTIREADEETNVAFFEAITEGDWVEIEEIESMGDLGDTSDVATFTSIADRRTRKMKTTYDAGTMTIVCGRDPLDAGQIALTANFATDFDYAFKLVLNDARDEFDTNSVLYFGAMVLSHQDNIGTVSDVTKTTFMLGVNTAVFPVPTVPLIS